jgi:hypothetical protein
MGRLSKDNINRVGGQGAKTFRPARVENPVVPKARTRPSSACPRPAEVDAAGR